MTPWNNISLRFPELLKVKENSQLCLDFYRGVNGSKSDTRVVALMDRSVRSFLRDIRNVNLLFIDVVRQNILSTLGMFCNHSVWHCIMLSTRHFNFGSFSHVLNSSGCSRQFCKPSIPYVTFSHLAYLSDSVCKWLTSSARAHSFWQSCAVLKLFPVPLMPL